MSEDFKTITVRLIFTTYKMNRIFKFKHSYTDTVKGLLCNFLLFKQHTPPQKKKKTITVLCSSLTLSNYISYSYNIT